MQDKVTRKVVLSGLRPIMFDRYSGNNTDQLSPEEKLYVNDKGECVLPAANLSSFLSAENTESAPKRLCGKNWRSVAKAALSFVNVEPSEIRFMANGKPIKADGKQVVVDRRVARLPKGIPNPKERPVILLPWELELELSLWPTSDLSENTLRRLFEEGGLCIGLGTFRGVYGKFEVKSWK